MATAAVGVRLEVRLLGPVEAVRDGAPVQLGPRQRALVAVLALWANEPVSVDRLVAALFGGDASETANAVQVAVSRLRRQLGAEAVETQAGGYLLRLPPEHLDVAEFERLVAEGRRLLDDGEPSAAAAALDRALGLFRGDPLADLGSHEFAQAEARRLAGLRLTAQTDAIEAKLAVGAGDELIAEIEALVVQHPLQERLRGQLMLAFYRAGRQSDALAAYRETRTLLNEELGLEPTRALQELERAILQQDPALDVVRRRPERDSPTTCPFKGLAPFTIDDADYFFGRERLVDELVAQLATSAFVGLVGASGSGKSSLVQAGLLRALAHGALPGSADWRIALVRPGDSLPGDGRDGRLVVAVDQLEELFTGLRSEDDRREFLDRLVELALDPRRRAFVVVALRADFYGRCAAYPAFATLLSASHVLLGPMRRDELIAAIEQPALQAGLRVEPELVDALVNDLGDEPGALPLLSTALLELWREREGAVLTHASYRVSGGLRGAVGRLAEQAFGLLTEEERTAARSLMLRLATEDDGAIVRRRAPLDELHEVADTSADRVLDVLTDARLVTVDGETAEVSHEALLTEWPRLRGWLEDDREGRRLSVHLAAAAREWEGGGRDAGDLYRGVRLGSALEWAGAHAAELTHLERAFLYESRSVDEGRLRTQRRRNRLLLALLVLALAAGAVALVQRQSAQNQATAALAGQLGAEAVSEPRVDLAMLLAAQAVHLHDSPQTEGTLLATLLRSPTLLASFSSPLDSRPQRLAVSPDGRTVAVSDNRGAVRFYDVASRRVRGIAHNFGLTSPVTFAGGRLLGLGWDGKRTAVQIRDAGTFRVVEQLPMDPQFRRDDPTVGTDSLVAPIVAADGETVFYAWAPVQPDGSDGPAVVDSWNLHTRDVRSAVVGVRGAGAFTLVRGGRMLVLVGTGSAAFVDARTLRVVRRVRLPSGNVAAAVAPDGKTIAFGTDFGTVAFVNTASGRVTQGLGSHPAPVGAIAFSPTGSAVVSSGDDGSLIVWNERTHQVEQRLVGHGSRVHGIGFSRDGKVLFTCSLDGVIFEWDLGSAHRFGVPFAAATTPPPFAGDVSAVPQLAVSPDGERFAARVAHNRVAIFDAADGRVRGTFAVLGPDATALAWSPVAPVVAATGHAGLVGLWSVRGTPRLVRRLRGLRSVDRLPETVESAAFSPDGRLLAAGDLNHTPAAARWRYGTVAVWNAQTGRLRWLRRNHDGWVMTLAFSADGTLLAAAQENGPVRIYRVADGRLVRTLPLPGNQWTFATLAWSRDGTLATGVYSGIAQLWNPQTGGRVGRPTGVASAPVSSLAFDPTRPLLATTGGSDGFAKLWTAASTINRFGSPFPIDPGTWGNAQFSADGSRLVVLYSDGHGAIWPMTTSSWLRHACSVAGRDLTREEWSRYVGGRAYEKTCG